ncbi:MAG: DUF3842 family protein [Peptococcaceae bacterium]|nr:DUF3842 family protein [Peptococcaceae bacterium]
MKVVVIDGQGGRIGKMLVEEIKSRCPGQILHAVGTNSIATSSMLKAGADCAATGENPVRVNSADADIIVGPIGLVIADSLLGEVTAAMALAVGRSRAQKVLVPVNKCQCYVAGVAELPLKQYIETAAAKVAELIRGGQAGRLFDS